MSVVTSAAGVRIPGILYGTAWKKGDTERLVAAAVAQGFRGIDTACQPRHYDEPGVGAGIAACLGPGLTRADLYLQTKFTPVSGHDPARIPYDPDAPLAEQIAQSCAVSLRNLKTDYLDCLVLHSPLGTEQQTLRAWQALESLVDAGGVRELGISNCYRLGELESLCRAARIKPAVLQNRFYADTDYDRGIRAFCVEERIVYQSFWTLSANPQVLGHAVIESLASRYVRTPAQILFRYLTQSGVVPLTGTRSEIHMREDLEIFGFALAESDRRAVDQILGA
ncbi:MAG: aldo/keto reductase [Steroidobacteraceae bacterium]